MMTLGGIPKINKNIGSAPTQKIRLFHKLLFDKETKDRETRSRIRDFDGFRFDANSSEYKKKVEWIKKEFSGAQLIIFCDILRLNYDDSSENLITLICDNLMNLEKLAEEDDDGDSSDEESKNKTMVAADKKEKGKVQDEEDDDEEDPGRDDAGGGRPHRFALTFRDLEGSIRSFDGGERYPVRKWIEDFEETSTLMRWDDMQKFIFAKKSLSGLAKLFIQGEKGIASWKKLKRALEKEFDVPTSAAEIHRLLSQRKKKRDESLQEYFLVMREIASRSDIDDVSLIQYVIDGIYDNSGTKLLLYGAREIKEFKEKLRQYEVAFERSYQKQFKNEKPTNQGKGNTETNQKEANPRGNGSTAGRSSDKRCYNCGGTDGHKSAECEYKSQGRKCFRCNKFGHIAAKCPEKEARDSSVRVAAKTPASLKMKEVTIRGNKVEALLDTGCQLNLLRDDVYAEMGSPALKETSIVLTGFGKNYVLPRGYFDAPVKIDDDTFQVDVYVVSADTLKVPAIIGNELLDEAEVLMNRNGIKVTKMRPETTFMRIEVYQDGELDIGATATEKMRDEIKDIVSNYHPEKKKDTEVEMNIIMQDEKPIFSGPRRLAPVEKEIVNNQVQQWLEEGIIEPSVSEYASQVVVTKKKDGTPRVCIDYRRLNKKVVKDKFPLPLIEDVLDKLCDARVFSTLDLKNGFFHVSVNPKSRKFTAFVIQEGHFQFLKVPFGLCNSPAVFQRFINTIFWELIREGIVFVYLDDLVIPARDEEKAMHRLKLVFEVAREYGLEIKFQKCQFLKKRIEFLGHVVEDGKIFPSPRKVEAVQRYPEPKSLGDILSFLGLTGYFRKFMPGYAKVAKPLSDLLKDNAKFYFERDQRIAFIQLKNLLMENPVLIIYNPGFETELHTDASMHGYGAVLLQRLPDDGQLHPVHYMSKKTKREEEKYCSYELEMLAVVVALKKFRVYLLGIPFKIVTDCSALQKTMDKKDLAPRVARWAMTMEEFNYTIEHRAGAKIPHADALSRHPCADVLYGIEDGLVSRIRKAQKADEGLNAIRGHLRDGPYKDFVLRGEILFKFQDGRETLVVPRSMQQEVVRSAHEKGHYAAERTREELNQEYYIPEAKKVIDRVLSNCIRCLLVNRKRGKQEGLLHPLFKEDTPLHTYHVDHVGPLKPTSKRYQHIFAVIDSFTKFVWLYPTKTTTTKEVIDKLGVQKNVFGNPAQIVSDRGPAFTSNQFKEYCVAENITHKLVTTGLPRANGQVERINAVLVPILTKLSLEEPEMWYRNVEAVQRAMNSTYHRSINRTPFELLMGTTMRDNVDLRIVQLINNELVDDFDEKRDGIREEARLQILKMQEENKQNFNRRRKPAREYDVGDIVAIKKTQLGPGLKTKRKYLGPYRVTKAKRNDTYDVAREGVHEGPRQTTTCAEYMKPWTDGYSSSEADDTQDGRMWDSDSEFAGFAKDNLNDARDDLNDARGRLEKLEAWRDN